MINLKKYMAVVGIICLFCACNDEWKDELYSHMISLKAPVNDEGVADIYLRYKVNGEVTYQLPVLVSGSTLLDHSTDVHIGVDNDTLAILNMEKYQLREDLYYMQLPEQFYEFESPICHIPAGSNKELFPIKFKFDGLDLSQEWVLPLTVEENDSYTTNKRKGWRKALLHILPFNDYSGNYSATAMNLYLGDSNNDPMVMDNRKAYVVDENTIFFYAGFQNDNAINRFTYKMYVRFEEPNLKEDGTTQFGSLTLWAENQEIGFKVEGQPTYEIRFEQDPVQPYLEHQYFVLNMKYRYKDITTVPGNPIDFRAEGMLTMERKFNTLIPDEDQAIMW